MRTKNRHGDHQEIHVGTWKLDLLGVSTGSVQRHLPENFDSIAWPMLKLAAAPQMGGVPCVACERSYDPGLGMGIYTYTYEGASDDITLDAVTFSLDFAMNEEPIDSHPNFALIRVKYDWDARRQRFNDFIKSSGNGVGAGLTDPAFLDAADRLGLSGQAIEGGSNAAFAGDRLSTPTVSGGQIKNPLLGTTSYLEIGAVFRRSYAQRTVPPGVLDGIGRITAKPPGLELFGIKISGGRRNWLKLAPKITRRGNCVQVSEEWMLSGKRGWNSDIYG